MIGDLLVGTSDVPFAPADPLLKYAGSKRWLAGALVPLLREHLSSRPCAVYAEKFAGSLAIGLSLGRAGSIYADVNADLANLYAALSVDAEGVALRVDALRGVSGEDVYYKVRESIWPGNRERLHPAAWAARTIWLNRHCFNGLMRYGKRDGRFNVPWGRRGFPALPSREDLLRAGAHFRQSHVLRQDFSVVEEIVEERLPEVVVYADPPYGAPMVDAGTGISCEGIFTGYSGAFAWADQVRLAGSLRRLAHRGALVIASNAWAPEIVDLYRGTFEVAPALVRHSVGAKGDRRADRVEMLAVSACHGHFARSLFDKIKISAVRA